MRKAVFDAIRAARDGASFTAAEVARIDALLDSLSVAGEASGRVVSKAGLALIKSFEGLSLNAYPDPATGGEPWTVGFGATGPGIHKGVVWTQAQADSRFADDVSRFADGVSALLGTAPTTQGQFDAMVSLAYNIGLGNFKESTLLRLHKEGHYSMAADQFPRWNKASGKVMAGLTRRREAEAALYRKAA
jgi:GH24 family phage-related lysozyme (muramidase)